MGKTFLARGLRACRPDRKHPHISRWSGLGKRANSIGTGDQNRLKFLSIEVFRGGAGDNLHQRTNDCVMAPGPQQFGCLIRIWLRAGDENAHLSRGQRRNPARWPARSARPTARPSATGSSRSPVIWHRCSPEPSGHATNPSRFKPSPTIRASPPMGVRQVPSRASSIARSACRHVRVAPSLSGASARAALSLSSRRAIAMTPCPAAGNISSVPNTASAASARPNRLSPAKRKKRRIRLPGRKLAQTRVHVAAKQHRTMRSGRSASKLGLAAQGGRSDFGAPGNISRSTPRRSGRRGGPPAPERRR